MTEEPSPRERFDRDAADKFQALGEYVQAFERMVGTARFGAHMILARDQRQAELVNIVLHHHALSAQPLFDICRGLIAHVVTNAGNDVADADREATVSVLTQIAGDYSAAVSKRNDLLHGTWFIGYGGADLDPLTTMVIKRKVKAKGLFDAEIPQSAAGLRAEAKNCEAIRHLLDVLVKALIMPEGPRVAVNFRWEGKRWSTPVKSG